VSTEHSTIDFYVTGGTMSPEAESYIVRSADEELFRAVEKGEYSYVLTTRQMGKSSLMARTAQRLAVVGVRTAQITLETIRESSATPSADQFLYGIASRIHRALGLNTPLADWWRARDLLSATQRFDEFLTELVQEGCDNPIVVFIDEIDSTIGLPFADDFFATIRACYNGRASKPALKRLTFVLLGVATPAQLIADPARTPFNIGTGIELTDFTLSEAESLTRGFPGSDSQKRMLLHRVLYWTGGHPYLTQTLCRGLALGTVSGDVGPAEAQATVDAEVERLFLRPEAAREEANLKFVRSRLTQRNRDLRAVLRTYQRVLTGKHVEDKPASFIHASLKLAGVVRTDAHGFLRPRNRIYERLFGVEWVRRELPRDRWRIAAAAAALLLVVGGSLSVLSLWRARTEVTQQTLQAQVAENLATGNFARLVELARARYSVYGDVYTSRWDTVGVVLSDDFLQRVDPGLFATTPWLSPSPDPSQVLDLIGSGYATLVPSRALFGAMSFALEEVWLRSSDVAVRARARRLAGAVRDAFVTYHEERTPNFQAPPARAEDDILNAWAALPGDEFMMGSEDGELDERPPHRVRVSGFWIQRHEVTHEEYRRFQPDHPIPAGEERHHPVENVSWYEAVGYAAWLGASLPTEAEWEYAAAGTGAQQRSGRSRRYPWGGAEPSSDRAVFWLGLDQPASASPVESRVMGRTPEGIDDMAGNVREWCRDWFADYSAQPTPVSDPWGPTSQEARDTGDGPERVLRGGSYLDSPPLLRAAFRFQLRPSERAPYIGFRLVSSRFRP